MNSAPTRWDALLARLAAATPELGAVVEAVVIIAAALRRRPRKESPRATIARREGRRLIAFPQYLVHETVSDEWVALDVETHPPLMKAGTWTADGSIVVVEAGDGDARFEWSWREVASGLAAALHALPSRARAPKAMRCPHCRKEFVS